MTPAKFLYVYSVFSAGVSNYLIFILLLYAASLFFLRKRLLHVFEPAHVYVLLSITSFASFLLFYKLPGITWTLEFVAIGAAYVPFFLFYGVGRKLFRRAYLSAPSNIDITELQILAIIVATIIILQGAAVVVGAGFQIAGGGPLADRLNLLKTSIILTYTEPAAVTLVPPLLWVLRKQRGICFFLLISMLIYTLKMIFLASKASIIVPVLVIFSVLFFRRLDQSSEGADFPPLYAQRSFWLVLGVTAIAAVGVFAASATSGSNFFTGDIATTGLSRLMLGFDDAIYSGVVDLKASSAPPYCVICSYAAFTKFISPELAPRFNNFGEYYGAYVLNFDYERNPVSRYLTLPNSTMPLEFLFSFGFALSIIAILVYSYCVVQFMRIAEKRRYKNIRWFIAFSYLMFNPLLYILDGASFIFGIYGSLVIYIMFVLAVLVLKRAGVVDVGRGHHSFGEATLNK